MTGLPSADAEAHERLIRQTAVCLTAAADVVADTAGREPDCALLAAERASRVFGSGIAAAVVRIVASEAGHLRRVRLSDVRRVLEHAASAIPEDAAGPPQTPAAV